MFKTVGLLKRKPGMTTEEFRKYYESQHRLIGEKYLKGKAEKYMRRFLSPYPNPITGEQVEPEYDVILEIWYASRSAFEETGKILSSPEAAKEIAEDEEKLFDRPMNRFFFVEEVESELGSS
tara:strand:- start:164 stop:529 length:366 start_codon:yes stop_codon:yes gene_type:complete